LAALIVACGANWNDVPRRISWGVFLDVSANRGFVGATNYNAFADGLFAVFFPMRKPATTLLSFVSWICLLMFLVTQRSG
jgi:hypothetical protein